MAEAPGDLTRARQTHWLHSKANHSVASGIPESEKAPLEGRVWYGYAGQAFGDALTNALGKTLALKYNAQGYLTHITGSIPGAVTSFTYDGTNRVRTITDSDGYTLTFDYDAADRVTKITHPDGTYEQMVYERLDLVAHRDRLGRVTRNTYDPLQRLVEVRDALDRVTRLGWCGCGGLESLTDPLGRVTSWVRDLQGRVTAKIYPDGRQVSYAYERLAGRLKEMTDALGQKTVYEYLPDDNLKRIRYTNAVVATPSVSFGYDPNYNRLTAMTNDADVTSYTYYGITNPLTLGAGRLATVDGPFSDDTISYTYDELGRVKTRAINGVAQAASYDALGRVTQMTNVLGGFTNAYVGATLRLSTNFFPNGQKTLFNYFGTNADLRLEEIKHLDPSGNVLSKFNYTYDAEGQIATWTQQTNAGSAKVYELGYDTVNQLLSAVLKTTGPGASVLKKHAYTYDHAGNRTGEQIDGYPSQAAHNNLNQLTSIAGGGPVRFKGYISETGSVTVAGSSATMKSGTNFLGSVNSAIGTNLVPVIATDVSTNRATNTYTVIVTNGVVSRTLSYDLVGNLLTNATSFSTNIYAWDAANRLVVITQRLTNAPVRVTEFGYDGLGRRVRQIEKTNGVEQSNITFLWCGTELCEERDSTGGTVTKRFFVQGEQISGTNYFFIRDHLGSVREMTDSNGIIRARYDYDPYGRRTKVQGDLESDFGFTGHYVHEASGLHLALYRAYDAETRRWANRDPMGEWDGPNLYAYVGNNPIMFVDAFGLTWSEGIRDGLIGVGVGIVVGAVVVATLPASVAAGMAIGAAAVGGYMVGKNAYEFISVEEAYTGRPLTQDEWATRGGHAIVDAASLGVATCKWFNRGAKNDWNWLKAHPRRRWSIDRDKMTVSPATWGNVGGIPPGQRGLTPFNIDPTQYPTTWGFGASPALRFVWPFGVAGSGVSEQIRP